MLKTKEGARVLGEMAVNCKPQVCACYPITPTTHLTEELNRYYSNGRIPEYITVEAEFSAISALIGASAAGSRTFTTTGGQGLLYMHEPLFSAAGMRLPIVMLVGNRAVSSPLNIWNDEQDSISQRDTGWIQIYCKNNQEAVDAIPQAFYVAEKILLPVMVCVDGHYLTHAVEQVDVADEKVVDEFLPPYKYPLKLDPENPVSLGVYANPTHYQIFREDIMKDMEQAKQLLIEAGKKWGKLTGRTYGLVSGYKVKDADRVIVGVGSVMDNVITVVNELREKGEKVGALHLRVFRPFPHEELREALAGRKIGVIDRDISIGGKAPIYLEVLEALSGTKAQVSSFFGGLGGRGIKRTHIREMFEKMKKGPVSQWVATEAPKAAMSG
ncbi:MAG: pyruvate ferredoxin oxidoreductase [Candidatus Diapherotrites archaeon]|uniref:Pyruvate ferredoxin oxidoreductase n=1 Tax=Candidatus Iainarchaeum sp. TaxID=3101447 RepID=A0A8T3YKX7_9ARCH|nr:pyruvate ferredoxin oxidoreductase [Candidatus Diapherotrites archaeon]